MGIAPLFKDQQMAEKFIKLLETTGDFIKNIGYIEKTTGKKIEEIYEEILTPENLVKLSDVLPSEIIGKILYLTYKINQLSIKIRNIGNLDPDEKIRIGNELINIAKEYRQTIREIDRFLEEQGKNKEAEQTK